MAHNTHIDQLGVAVGQNYVGRTNALGLQGYAQLNSNQFLNGADIQVKSMSFSNDGEGSNYAFGATPVTLPTNPALNATLTEIFDDYFVYWRYNGATWDKLTEEYRYYTYQLDYSAQGTSIAYGGMCTHVIHNTWRLVRICVYNNSGTIIGPTQVIQKNGAAFGPVMTIAANAGLCAGFAAGSFLATLDYFQVDPAAMPAAPVVFAVTITLQKP